MKSLSPKELANKWNGHYFEFRTKVSKAFGLSNRIEKNPAAVDVDSTSGELGELFQELGSFRIKDLYLALNILKRKQ